MYNEIRFDLPLRKLPFDAGFEPGRKGLGNLRFITQPITFCHHSLIGVREQWREPLDIVVWSLEQLGDGDGIVEAWRKSQQHLLHMNLYGSKCFI